MRSARPTATRWRLPPDNLPGRRSSKMTDNEQFNHTAELFGVSDVAADPACIVQISVSPRSAGTPGLPKDIADAPPPRRNIDAAATVKQDIAV